MASLKEKLSQEKANHLNETGGTLLCWDVPTKIHFGIDYLTFETAQKFKGVKMLPPGPHFIHTSVQTSERMGFFIWIDTKQINVYEWDESIKCLINFTDKEQADRLRLGVLKHDFDANLGAYPLQTYSKWKKLSNHITQQLIQKLGPKSGIISSTYSEIKNEQKTNENNDKNDENDGNNEETDKEADLLNERYNSAKNKYSKYHPKYSKIPTILSLKKDGLISPSQLSLLHLDKTMILDKLIVQSFAENEVELLGELQYSFICLLIGQSVQGLEQWKSLVDLICNCLNAMQNKQDFYCKFLDVIVFEFKQLPNDFFKDQITNDNFLNKSLQNLLEIAGECKLRIDLVTRIEKLKNLMKSRFEKTFDLDQDAPIVVDTSSTSNTI